jgi:ABC-type transport system involved in cytochrome c biogenesis permease subunit
MHARALRNWRGSRAAMLSILGFASIVFNIFVVNFVISGLHSYAGG